MPNDGNDRVFDVSKPHKVTPSATSKPVIVGHQPMMGDPMVKDDSATPPPMPTEHKSIPVSMHGETGAAEPIPAPPPPPPPPVPDHPESVAAAAPDKPAPLPPGAEAPPPPVTPPGDLHLASLDDLIGHEHKPSVPPADAQQQVQEAQQPVVLPPHHHPRKKSKTGLWLALALLATIVGAYLLIDSGLAKTSINLPFHVFKQSVPAAVVTQAPAQTAAPTVTDPYVGWVTYTSTAEPTLSFQYPSDWQLTKNKTSLGLDSVSLSSPSSSSIYWGTASAGTGGNCNAKDTIVVKSVAPVAKAPGLYLVSWTTTTYTNSGTTSAPQTQDSVAVLDESPDQTTPPKTGSYKGCIYPSRFANHKADNSFSFGTVGVYSTQDLANIKLILASLKY